MWCWLARHAAQCHATKSCRHMPARCQQGNVCRGVLECCSSALKVCPRIMGIVGVALRVLYKQTLSEPVLQTWLLYEP